MKEKTTIVVIDSGLGGLSVFFELSKLLEPGGIAKENILIFVNALYDKDYGYNDMKTDEEKISMLDWVLKSIDLRFNPDYIVVACNTLSVLLNKTDFYKEKSEKLFGIIEPALDFIGSVCIRNPNNNFIILGTPTTIKSGVYQNKLRELGQDENRIVSIACPKLETEIQRDPESETVMDMLENYLFEAKDMLPKEDADTFILLGCTHYSVVLPSILTIAEYADLKNTTALDTAFIQAISFVSGKGLCKESSISHSVYSRVPLFEDGNTLMLDELEIVSPKAYSAAMNYIYDPDLF